ncbi:hypothetical protein [Bacillus sp. SRB1LM]|uniref:hypothetical protein n=1 Tax=Bacillus sp. SRB1LM TaxID=2608688 RepID=UPI0018C3602F|nr:hypothetical protein [Bacillus sp. SRB1LM]
MVRVLVTMEAFGTTVEEEIEVKNTEMIDWEIEELIKEAVSYDYEVIDETEEDEETE